MSWQYPKENRNRRGTTLTVSKEKVISELNKTV